jgi:hypothetical protein
MACYRDNFTFLRLVTKLHCVEDSGERRDWSLFTGPNNIAPADLRLLHIWTCMQMTEHSPTLLHKNWWFYNLQMYNFTFVFSPLRLFWKK